MPAAGYELHTLRVGRCRAAGREGRAGGRDRRRARSARRLRILRAIRPAAVLGAGGYVAGPVGLAAVLARRPAGADGGRQPSGADQPAAGAARAAGVPGVPDRGPRRRAATASPGGRFPPPATDRAAARARFGIGPDETCVLVFGGSQGARSINHAAIEAFAGARFRVLHAAGERDLPDLQSPGPHYDLRGYISDFGEALIASDLVVARSGGSIFEIAAAGRPAVLIPYPYATADHQTANARFMERAGAAVVIPDAELTARGWPRRSAACSRTAAGWRRWRAPRRRWRGPTPRARSPTRCWRLRVTESLAAGAPAGPDRAGGRPRDASPIARSGQNVPEDGPPLQWPLLAPGTPVQRNASTCGEPVCVVRQRADPAAGWVAEVAVALSRRMRIALRALAVLRGVDDEVGPWAQPARPSGPSGSR